MSIQVDDAATFDQLPQAPIDGGRYLYRLIAVSVCLLLATAWATRSSAGRGPPRVREGVPFVTNTFQFLLNNSKFMSKAVDALQNSNIAKFYLGGVPVYLVTGARNTQAVFGRGTKVGSEDILTQNVFPRLYRMPPHHVSRFANDKSGRGRVPAPGHEDEPAEERYWLQYEHYQNEFLLRPQYTKPMVEIFRRQFTEALNAYPVGESVTVDVKDFCRTQLTETKMRALFGPNIFSLNPNFLDVFWEFDKNIMMLTLGFPRWLYSRPYKAQDQYLSMIGKYVDSAFKDFDWDGPSSEAPWEPHFGARVCREVARWLRNGDFTDMTIAGALGMLLFAQNTNAIPTAMWIIMELAKDPSLFREVRKEVADCWVAEPATGERVLDMQKISETPLFQSLWTETLRVRMNFNVLRQVNQSFELDGVDLKKGNMVQVPMMVPHFDETVWGAVDHPASEFWAERHIKYTEQTDKNGKKAAGRSFAMAARPSSYFPFGGGATLCPGRHFAKLETAVMVGLLVSKFEIEKVEWVNDGGSPSDRPAENDLRYCGVGAMPPDREMRMTWRRVG